MEDQFWFNWGFLFAALVVAHLYLRYNKRRYPTATDTDQAMWRIYATSLAFGASIFVSMTLLNTSSFPIEIAANYPADVKQNILEMNVAKQTERINKLQDNLKFLSTVLVFYLFGLAAYIAMIQRKRHLKLLKQDPARKNPLNL